MVTYKIKINYTPDELVTKGQTQLTSHEANLILIYPDRKKVTAYDLFRKAIELLGISITSSMYTLNIPKQMVAVINTPTYNGGTGWEIETSLMISVSRILKTKRDSKTRVGILKAIILPTELSEEPGYITHQIL